MITKRSWCVPQFFTVEVDILHERTELYYKNREHQCETNGQHYYEKERKNVQHEITNVLNQVAFVSKQLWIATFFKLSSQHKTWQYWNLPKRTNQTTKCILLFEYMSSSRWLQFFFLCKSKMKCITDMHKMCRMPHKQPPNEIQYTK